jgi:hypothetical protein
MSACRRWNEKPLADKTWAQFKAHFSAANRQHKQMAEATIGALANLATATASYRGVVATLTEANARLIKQLEDNSNKLRELKALIKK